ncbi:hypothetical protein [Stutzerimonas stutzeri]|uniref:hypothetical protein n=1 Tax=Stutzerimonas stutzeri TaxID=316 RepID=UPI00037A3700|nr:hypothetical protein [Stutzerimonas stutzeri]
MAAPAFFSADLPSLLSSVELIELDNKIRHRTDFLISIRANNVAKPKASAAASLPPAKTSNRGRPPRTITNLFAGLIGPTTGFGRYPFFAMDIIEGVARLDWHDHGSTEVSKPLSVKRLMLILETIEVVTTATVSELLGIGARHAQRYVKAIQLAIPFLMKSRPKHLIDDMEGNLPIGLTTFWDDTDPVPPCPVDLAKLHRAMGIDAIELTPHV